MDSSKQLFERAQKVIPGGVNSPVRAFRAVGGNPLFIRRASGAHLYDVDGRKYIDYIGSWGPMIAGHSHPKVIAAVRAAALDSLSFGAPCEAEVTLAERLCELIDSLDQVRMVNSGTEACMSAVRLARGFTGRDVIVKFAGCYHGHADSFLVKAGSGALTLGVPDSPGVPKALADLTLTLPYNDAPGVEALFAECGKDIACVIVEPVAGNMNCIAPEAGFLETLRSVCDQSGAILIFDEVMTGFRVALGGAQSLYGVRPDLTTFGKVIGGGMPVGAFGGRADIMAAIAPSGPVYQAGTLSGNPIAMAAGSANLDLICEDGFYDRLGAATVALSEGLAQAARQAGVPLFTRAVGGMFGFFFTDEPEVTRFDQVMACDQQRFVTFFQAMLARGVYLAPSAFEAGFVSAAHDHDVIEATLHAAAQAFDEISR